MLSKLLKLFKERTEWGIGLMSLIASVFVLGRVLNLNLMKVLTDENAHLNFARSLFDSTTPGISQIGFWPPLLHLLLAPFASVPFLYRTGLAGSIVLIPFFIAGNVFLYRLLMRLTKKQGISIAGTLLFMFNPYILYYAVTPMMEVLFLANLFAVAYFIVCWLQEDKLKFLLLAAVFTALAGLSRYEGFVLIPVLAIIFGLQTLIKRKTRSELQATLIVFLFVAIIGAAAVIGYSWFYSGNPFSFAGGAWIRDPFEQIFPTKHNLLDTLVYFLHASYYMVGQPVVYLGLASAGLLLFFLRKRLDAAAALLVTLSPVALVLFAVYSGSYSISVPELPPITIFLNERYGLTWIGFLILAPALLAAYLIDVSRNRRFLYNVSLSTASFLMTAALCFNFGHFYSEAFLQNFQAVALNSNRPLRGQTLAAEYLKDNYDYGKILITRADNDPTIANAGLPIRDYIFEANYLYFNQAVNEPWLFARWVVMHNPSDQADKWAQQNELISRQWGKSTEFSYYYTLVSENNIRQIYRVNDQRVAELARSKGWSYSEIPSVNRGIAYWAPENIYDRIKQPNYATAPAPVQTGTGVDFLKMMGLKAIQFFGIFGSRDTADKPAVRKSLISLYRSDLRPDYAAGFFVDQNRQGTSESQSYALLQSYWAGDKQTFDRVWNWTNQNLKRPNDNLFSWKFSVNEPAWRVERKGAIFVLARVSPARVEDPNSATDADSDIAFALLKAGEAWKRPDYVEAGKRIAGDIYEKETGAAAGQRILTAGNWGDANGKIYNNPSYFAPYEYRLFAQYDSAHDWNKLVADNYQLLSKVMTQGPLGQYRLPPNWIVVDKTSGSLSSFAGNPDANDYTYDAFRTFWRVALDQVQNPNPQASAILSSAVFPQANGGPCTIWQRTNGSYQCKFQSNLLAAPLAVYSAIDSGAAKKLVGNYYISDKKIAIRNDAFFAKSWHWFGLAIYGAS